MRERISRALVRVLDVLPLARRRRRRRRPGRHTAAHLVPRAPLPPTVICTARLPVPPHVLARTAPSPWGHRVPPYLGDWIAQQEAEWATEDPVPDRLPA
ncbi:hypothetical protein [Streptomyces sp. NPDC002490]|uniref:hypothetical protein n=1 Tax=Streptomyces sp. NPDC002490 TaxID=3154416 RepID=UPI00332DE7FE